MTEDEIFAEEDFEAIEKCFPADNDPFWDVEETYEIGDDFLHIPNIPGEGLEWNEVDF